MERSPKLILSFLGTGNYQSAKYPLDGEEYETPYTQEAILRRYESEGYALKVLMTKEAEAKHAALLGERVKYEAVPIPSGHTEEELWEIFNSSWTTCPRGRSSSWTSPTVFAPNPSSPLRSCTSYRQPRG